MSVRAEPRFTRDIDLTVAVASDVRLLPPGESVDGVVVDLLFASSGIEPEICAAAEPIEVASGVRVPVARAGHLLAQKILSRGPERLQDDLDIRAIMADMDPSEKDRCRQALRAVVAQFESLMK